MREPLKVLDLFSGIGGFSLGLERTGGFKTVAFCEIEEYPRRVLAKHWPGVPIYDDVRTLTADRLAADGIAVDVICGGFPCQDISLAGGGAGIHGKRSGLWFEYSRIVREIRPRFVLVENVAELLDRGMDEVLGTLAASGFDAEWDCVPGYYGGAPQARDRIFIVAYPSSRFIESSGAPRDFMGPEGRLLPKGWHPNYDLAEPGVPRVARGVPHRFYRVQCLGNAVVPQIPEIIGRAILEAEASLSRPEAA